jgi:SAM-dependent methyltransferase
VLATDISATMLAAADQNAREAGLSNIRTLVSDASALEVPEAHFDAAICRFGLMFVPDLHQALSRIHRALKPSAHFAALVWASQERNPWMGMQVRVLTDVGHAPPPGASVLQALSLSDSAALEAALSAAGFQAAATSPVATPRSFASLDEAVDAMHSTSPVQRELLRQLDADERERYLASLRKELATYVQPDGELTIPGEAILATATR